MLNNLMNNIPAPLWVGAAVVAFLVSAILVLLIVRMLFGGGLRMPGGRARQARLGIVDAFDLDRQRQLIIVRRDNTEHLIMIGGPNDILIESEIVRVEARDFRDGRRDVPADARIPAPIPQSPVPLDRPELKLPDQPVRPIVEEPMLPIPLPEPSAPSLSSEPPPVRTPTFPLPPRRPMPMPERRPTPPPPRLPDSVSRAEDTAPIVTSPGPTDGPAPDAAPSPLAPPPLAPPISAPARTAPPFLKPLTPRTPMRPLQRTTTQPPAPPSVSPPAPPVVAGPPVEAPPPVAPSPQVVAPPPPPPPAPPPSPPTPVPTPAAEPVDALESLEEEMAKLLGRGPG